MSKAIFPNEITGEFEIVIDSTLFTDEPQYVIEYVNGDGFARVGNSMGVFLFTKVEAQEYIAERIKMGITYRDFKMKPFIPNDPVNIVNNRGCSNSYPQILK